jgi:hypothetical protein
MPVFPEAGGLPAPSALVNWPWLEDLLVRCVEHDVEAFAAQHPLDSCFAACLEFDPLIGRFSLAYGTQDAVEQAWKQQAGAAQGADRCYRALELRPSTWRFQGLTLTGPEASVQQAETILERYRERAQFEEGENPEAALFLQLRFQFLAECVVRRIMERDGLYPLARDSEFLAYTASPYETLEDVEDRLCRFYPEYRRATAEFVEYARWGSPKPRRCREPGCRRSVRVSLERCTYCGVWLCSTCRLVHEHPELARKLSFFDAPVDPA